MSRNTICPTLAKKTIIRALAKGRLELALSTLLGFFPNYDKYTYGEAVILSFRFYDLKKAVTRKLVSWEEESRTRREIAIGVLYIVSEMGDIVSD